MPEFMVTMHITFPTGMPANDIKPLLDEEARAAKPYLDSGQFSRVWRTYGSHMGSHGHLALWNMRDMADVALAYQTFPLVRKGYGVVESIIPLAVNPNDRRNAPLVAESPIPLTYYELNNFLGENGRNSTVTKEGVMATLVTGVTIHDHPHSGRPREIHFMVDGQKVAEIGPTDKAEGEDVAPGYIDFLAEWDGRPVSHQAWKNRILADNGLLYADHSAAKSAPRHSMAAKGA